MKHPQARSMFMTLIVSIALLGLSIPSLSAALGGQVTVEVSHKAGAIVMYPWQHWGIVIVLWGTAASLWLPSKKRG